MDKNTDSETASKKVLFIALYSSLNSSYIPSLITEKEYTDSSNNPLIVAEK